MSVNQPSSVRPVPLVRIIRVYKRFTLGQRWEHAALMLSFITLILTGLPQKFFSSWGHYVLTSPEMIFTFRRIHLIAASLLTVEVIYHLGRAIWLMARRQLSSEIFPEWQDVRDAWQMLKYLLFLTPDKPAYGKYNFEQKFTYWFLFLGIGIMVISGFILWFPVAWTRFFTGAIIPAARAAHSTEAVVATIFVVIWHLYHVHIERLNLSIFTGRLNESEMREYHRREWERLAGAQPAVPEESTSQAERGEAS